MDNKKLIDKLKQLPRRWVVPFYYGGLTFDNVQGNWVRWEDIEQLIEEENNKPIGFGDIVEIEQHRYGADNEFYQYKVIGTLKSNAWIDVPVVATGKKTLHDESEDIVLCICAGIVQEKVERFRLKDVKLCDK